MNTLCQCLKSLGQFYFIYLCHQLDLNDPFDNLKVVRSVFCLLQMRERQIDFCCFLSLLMSKHVNHCQGFQSVSSSSACCSHLCLIPCMQYSNYSVDSHSITRDQTILPFQSQFVSCVFVWLKNKIAAFWWFSLNLTFDVVRMNNRIG